jgi:hypothetical protein
MVIRNEEEVQRGIQNLTIKYKVKREVFDIGSEPNIPRLGSMPYSTSMARHAA